jgi:hypothetical protein
MQARGIATLGNPDGAIQMGVDTGPPEVERQEAPVVGAMAGTYTI